MELFWAFFKIGAVTFGGGLAMLPILERDLVEKRAWTTKENLLDYFAIGQATPGIIAVNVATFLGYNHAGILGGCVATCGVVAPSVIVISFIALFLAGFNDIVLVEKALCGINVAVSALLCKILWGFRKNILESAISVLLCIAAFCAIVIFHVNTVIVICAAMLIGCCLYVFEKRKSISQQNENTAEENSR